MAAISVESISLYSSSSSVLRGSLQREFSRFAVSSSRRSADLSRFAGLKIQSRPNRFSASVSSGSSRRSVEVSCGTHEVAVDIPAVTDATWESLVLKADGPVLVEFWASWCGPCRMIHPVIGELANEYAGKLKFFKLNTDDSPSIATRYGIKSIPTTMLFVNGEKKDLVLGAVPKTTLIGSIEKVL